MAALEFDPPGLVVTTGIPADLPVENRLGLVVSNIAPGRNIGKDLLASVRDVVGGRSESWEETLVDHQQVALEELAEQATDRGADALLGVSVQVEVIDGSDGLVNVAASGTAVELAET